MSTSRIRTKRSPIRIVQTSYITRELQMVAPNVMLRA